MLDLHHKMALIGCLRMKAEAQTGHRIHGLKAPDVHSLAKVEMDGYTILHRSWAKVCSATHLHN
ncbi:MAG: hypothetical protein DMG92_14055 [Acidobacteria bacterium]|nr:MAG: hypothetical protein DMG92_14055 [Acidobacteriota bacterium]